MKQNRLTIKINRPVEEVFDFTTNPKNTPLWILHLRVEESTDFPPKINTIYRNRGKSDKWDIYKVIELEKNKLFTLSDGNYSVRYTYKNISGSKTEMDYFEWMLNGELDNPFKQEVLQKLKEVMEG